VAVLIAPGNAGSRLDRVPLARALADVGFTVLLMDYRGYGGNPGDPSQSGIARDVRAAREYLAATAGFTPDRTIYFGESLGAAVVTELATVYPPAGLVLRSPFTDLAAVGRHHYPIVPVRGILRDRYPVADLIDQIMAPTVVIYGAADSVVPPRQSRAVAARAGGLTRLIPVDGADHNDPVLLDGAPVIDAVVEVADRIGGCHDQRQRCGWDGLMQSAAESQGWLQPSWSAARWRSLLASANRPIARLRNVRPDWPRSGPRRTPP
jgi:pimeloyl-ACP methyl ester carboxylesterase